MTAPTTRSTTIGSAIAHAVRSLIVFTASEYVENADPGIVDFPYTSRP